MCIRDRVVPKWIQEEALDTASEGYDRLLFLYGCFQHPGDVFPKPASSGGVEIKWHVAEVPSPHPDSPPIPPSDGLWGH
eukprot:5607635-Pyramimonas_sp.AAC.1